MPEYPDDKYVSYWWACDQVGRAFFGAEHVKSLTARERWILAVLHHADEVSGAPIPEPDMQARIDRIPRWIDREEALRALRQWVYSGWQFDQVWDWFEDWGVELHPSSEFGDWFDLVPFLNAFAEAFPGVVLDNRPDPDQERKIAIALARSGSAGNVENVGTPQKRASSATRPIGRPPKWDWDAMHREVIRLSLMKAGLPQTQAKLEATIADWFMATTGDQPAESQIREKVSAIFQALTEAGKARN